MASETADREDLFVARDSDGELLPVEIEVPGIGTVEGTPFTYGDANKWLGDGGVADLEAEGVAEILREKVTDPDLSDIDGEDVEGMKPLVPAFVIEGLVRESGVDADVTMDEDGSATVDFDQGN